MTPKKIVNTLALLMCGATFAHAYTLSGNVTVGIDADLDPAELNDGASLVAAVDSNIIFDSSVNVNIDVNSYTFLARAGSTVRIDKGAQLAFYCSNSATSYPVRFGNLDVSGNIAFVCPPTSTTNPSGVSGFVDYTGGSGATAYKAGAINVYNGGVFGTYYGNNVDSRTTCRMDLWNDSSLIIHDGGTVYTQSVQMKGDASLVLKSANSALFNSAAQTQSSFIIFFANAGHREKLVVADNYTHKDNYIIFANNSHVDLTLAEVKAADARFTLKGFKAYEYTSDTKSTEMNVFNFKNDYIFFTDFASFSVNEDGSIMLNKLTSSSIATTAIFTAYAGSDTTGEGFSTGWVIDEVYNDQNELEGYYLNNTNFPIPEPAEYAAMFGLCAIGLAYISRRNKIS